MGDLLSVELSRPPWAPALDATVSVVLHHYDHPLIGVISQAGHDFAFWCVIGQNNETGVWAYARLEDGDIKRLTDATSSPEKLAAVLAEVTHNRGRTATLASDSGGVLLMATLDQGMTFGDDADAPLEALRQVAEVARNGIDALNESELATA